jgi:DNA-binding IclR family transcriptional regulator
MARDDRFTTLTPAVEQAAEILLYLASDSNIRVSLTHISRTVNINKSKTHVILNALQKYGFVVKDPEGKLYSLGFGLIPVGLTALENANYRDVAKPILVELARETNCTALFGLIIDDNLVITESENSGQPVESRLKVGYTLPLFYGAHGKVIAASLPSEEQERLIGSNSLIFDNESSELGRDALRQDLAARRRDGFALHILAGPSDMIKSLASAVLGATGRPVGCLLIVGVFPRSDVQAYGAQVAEAARKLARLLGANPVQSHFREGAYFGE